MGRTVVSARFVLRGYIVAGGRLRTSKAPRFLAAKRCVQAIRINDFQLN